jgi:HNH endonuclease/AP2 domain
MATIQLGGKRGGVAIVDDDLFDLLPDLRQVKWHVGASGYVRGCVQGKVQHLHRIIGVRLLDCRPGEVVDHRDGDKLDNRRSGLRPCLQRFNAANTPKKRNNTSGVVGVSWDRTRQKWLAHIKVQRKFINLGWHAAIESAAAARKTAEAVHFGEFANGNPRVESLQAQQLALADAA